MSGVFPALFHSRFHLRCNFLSFYFCLFILVNILKSCCCNPTAKICSSKTKNSVPKKYILDIASYGIRYMYRIMQLRSSASYFSFSIVNVFPRPLSITYNYCLFLFIQSNRVLIVCPYYDLQLELAICTRPFCKPAVNCREV